MAKWCRRWFGCEGGFPQARQRRTGVPLAAHSPFAGRHEPRVADVWEPGHDRKMTKYLVSFPSEAMVLTEEEFPIVVAESHAVIEEAKAAGVYVFGGGIDEQVAPVLVAGDGSVSRETYPGTDIRGGFLVLEVATREEAEEWAAKVAASCRCSQELREFMYDPAS